MKTEKRTILTLDKATIYRQGDFGFNYHKTEVRGLTVEIGRYAQYDRGIRFSFVPKGARRARYYWETSFATTVVLAGWGHDLEPGGMFGKVERTVLPSGAVSEVAVSHLSCSPEWQAGFRGKLEAYCARTGITPAMDLHGHSPHSDDAKWFEFGGKNRHVHPAGPFTWSEAAVAG